MCFLVCHNNGFFIAGTIAADALSSHKLTIGALLILSGTVISSFFAAFIFHYGARIEILNKYISDSNNKYISDSNKSEIPNDWYVLHKKVSMSLDGVDSWFFLAIIFCLWLIEILM